MCHFPSTCKVILLVQMNSSFSYDFPKDPEMTENIWLPVTTVYVTYRDHCHLRLI